MNPRVLAACAALVLSGCTGSPPAAERDDASQSEARTAGTLPATYVYACPGGERFLVRIHSDSAIVELPPRVYRLPHVIAASGVRYEAGGIELWTKGDEARLAAPGVNYSWCRGTRAGTPWDAARLMGFEFRAVGQEPGWVLDIDQDGRRLSYLGDYGSVRLVAPLTGPDSAGQGRERERERERGRDGVTYRARTDEHGLTVTIRATPCQDLMSGEAFTHTVSLLVDGRELQGCGRALGPQR